VVPSFAKSAKLGQPQLISRWQRWAPSSMRSRRGEGREDLGTPLEVEVRGAQLCKKGKAGAASVSVVWTRMGQPPKTARPRHGSARPRNQTTAKEKTLRTPEHRREYLPNSPTPRSQPLVPWNASSGYSARGPGSPSYSFLVDLLAALNVS
jgi:hypothetical protein